MLSRTLHYITRCTPTIPQGTKASQILFYQQRQIRSFDKKASPTAMERRQQQMKPAKQEQHTSILDKMEDMIELSKVVELINQSKEDPRDISYKISDLLKDPKDTDLLISIIAQIVDSEDPEQAESAKKIKHIDQVDKILRDQLAGNHIPVSNLGIVNLYVYKMGGQPETFEYAIFRVYENLRKLPLIDIGYALMNIQFLKETTDQQKVLMKIQSHIVLTHDTLMKGKNLRGVIILIQAFDLYEAGNMELWKKFEAMLEDQLLKKKTPLEKNVVMYLFKVLTKKRIMNIKIWESLLSDLNSILEGGFVTLNDLVHLVKYFYQAEVNQPHIIEGLVEYLVSKGYDHDDFKEIGLAKGVILINQLILCHPEIQNANFLMHVVNFVQTNKKEFNRIQLARLVDAFGQCKFLKDENQKLFEQLQDLLATKREEKSKATNEESETGQTGKKSLFDDAIDPDDLVDEDFEILRRITRD